MRRRFGHSFALIARGFLLATAVWSGLFAWWQYCDQPTGSHIAMYAWIRFFYGSLVVCLISVVGVILTIGDRNSER